MILNIFMNFNWGVLSFSYVIITFISDSSSFIRNNIRNSGN